MRKVAFLFGLIVLLSACAEEDVYHYPPVKFAFLTAYPDASGAVQRIKNDQGETFRVENMYYLGKEGEKDSFRMVGNYEQLSDELVRLYASRQILTLTPKVFEHEVKTDPLTVQSLWLEGGYLNLVLLMKTDGGSHVLGVSREGVIKEEDGKQILHLLLYHDQNKDVENYSQRSYLSVALHDYVSQSFSIRLDVRTYKGWRTYMFGEASSMESAE